MTCFLHSSFCNFFFPLNCMQDTHALLFRFTKLQGFSESLRLLCLILMNTGPFQRRNAARQELQQQQPPCLVSVQYFTLLCSAAQLQSSGSSNSLMSPGVLGFPSSLSCFSTFSLLSPHTHNFILPFTCTFRAPRAVLYRLRSLL